MRVIGPVIGKVTSSSARVLVDVEGGGAICVVAERDGHRVEAETQATAASPVRAVTLRQLQDGARYSVAVFVDGVRIPQAGSFVTQHAGDTDWNFVAVSCNDRDYGAPGFDPYTRLYHDYVEPGVTAVLHLGDQVYADKVFRCCVGALRQVPKAEWPNYRTWVRNMYRQLYRDTWSCGGLRDILANASNLMIWDDHEVVDDWADRDRFIATDTVEHFVSREAWSTYREYQRQLWDDELEELPATGMSEQHMHRFGDLGLLFIDCRGGRAYQHDAARPYLGSAQWQAIDEALEAGGTLADARVLLVASPVPLVFMGPRATDNYEGDSDDLFGHWANDPYRPEQYALLKKLATWKAAQPGRELALLGGDVHVGLIMNIFERRNSNYQDTSLAFKQLVTSPIRRESHGGVLGAAYLSAINSDRLLFRDMRPTYAFRVESHLDGQNAGLIHAVRTSTGTDVRLRLVSV